ncbi:hypothetical protein [Fluviicola chungangensis]|uniref:Aromatic ring-opening dioxygenase LigA n=1 Tax=Fluviicola chungangensis TaxID=2597671 RepID=A0A556MQN2_9FLAO|nr:hypothetical protein [Fluviicola chungangensis]TSJ42059.1 hypothetical protein FO442_13295 [Fluviicola chungangensis]
MDTIKLNFINRSNDSNNSEIVIFQKNVSENADELAVAWKVIQNCGQGAHHPLNFPSQIEVAASDSWGNFTLQLPADEGQAFEMVKNNSGDVLQTAATSASNKNEIEVRNQLITGAISAYCFRDGSICAMKSGISPSQKAVFSFTPTIWIGVVSQVEEGQVLNSAIISSVNTEISLMGIAEADIVMTGGGPGSSSTPFRFTLENVVYA